MMQVKILFGLPIYGYDNNDSIRCVLGLEDHEARIQTITRRGAA